MAYICSLLVLIEYFIAHGSSNPGNVECLADFAVEIVHVFLTENTENSITEFGGHGALHDGKLVACQVFDRM